MELLTSRPTFKPWLSLHIGNLSDISLKHRSSVLLLSALMMFIDPNVTLTFGKASIVGLGVTVNPMQTLPVGLFLLVLLVYKLLAFWTSVLLESGTDSNIAKEKAMQLVDPKRYPEHVYAQNLDEAVKLNKDIILHKWGKIRIIWYFIIPNLFALASLIRYVMETFT